MSFIIDTDGDQKLNEQDSLGKSVFITGKRKTLINSSKSKETEQKTCDEPDEDDYFGLPPPSVDVSKLIEKALSTTSTVETSKTNRSLEEISVSIDAALNAQLQNKKRQKRVIDLDHSDFNMETGKFDDEQLLKVNVSEEMKNSRLKPGFEELHEQPNYGMYTKRRLNKLERAKTKGGDWYDIPATEVTEEVQNELKILQMRSVLDPKHFYKKNDLKVLPKYFQIGTVLPSPLDHYKERNTRKNKKLSLVDELLADTEFQSFNKRKYNESMARKSKYAHRKNMKKMKKLKKNK